MATKAEGLRHDIPSRFKVDIDREKCKICKRCTINCTFNALSFNGDRIVVDNDNCVACQRCAMKCPQEAITVNYNPNDVRRACDHSHKILRFLYQNIRRVVMSAHAVATLLSVQGSSDRTYIISASLPCLISITSHNIYYVNLCVYQKALNADVSKMFGIPLMLRCIIYCPSGQTKEQKLPSKSILLYLQLK